MQLANKRRERTIYYNGVKIENADNGEEEQKLIRI